MNRIHTLCIALCLGLASCGEPSLPNATPTEEAPALFPDYREVTIPANIAPLNFRLVEPREAILQIKGKGEEIRLSAEDGVFHIPTKKWHHLLGQTQGESLTVQILAKQEKGWASYPTFAIHVSEDKVDSYLAYRRIAPGYRMWNEMGIYQRNLENFEETTFLDNSRTNNNCMNCHSFRQQDPSQMLFHQRSMHSGTYVLTDGEFEKLSVDPQESFASLVYPYWHPSGRFIAFSTNDTKQDFHLSDPNRVEVFDSRSDVVIYDVQRKELFTSPLLASEGAWETFPSFSPDGKALYFCSAEPKQMPEEYAEVRYNLLRISFDPATRSFGEQIDTLYHADKMQHSTHFPRVSPDGKRLLFTTSGYGNFSIWHRDADLCMMDLQTGELDAMDNVNSDNVESYHSWSNNGRWFVFSSRREDGLYTRPYLCHIDADGQTGKPFLLPQEEPDYYDRSLFSFNIPEFVSAPFLTDTYELLQKSKYGASRPVQLK